MRKGTINVTVLGALPWLLVAGACHGKEPSRLAQDSAVTRDLTLARSDSPATPQLRDTGSTLAAAPRATAAPHTETEPRGRAKPARRPAPRGPTSAPTTTSTSSSVSTETTAPGTITPNGNAVSASTAGSEGSAVTLPTGTAITLTAAQRVCTNTVKVGDHFDATVSGAVSGLSGSGIPAGAKADVEVTSAQHSSDSSQPITMGFSVLNVSYGGKTYPLTSEVTHVDIEKVRNASVKSDAVKVAGGAVIGAILGRVLGHNTSSTVIGGATGAAAGTAVALGTAAYEGCVPVGGKIDIRLTAPATVQSF